MIGRVETMQSTQVLIQKYQTCDLLDGILDNDNIVSVLWSLAVKEPALRELSKTILRLLHFPAPTLTSRQPTPSHFYCTFHLGLFG